MAGLEVFGRERELADLRAFLCGRQHTGALLLTGAVGALPWRGGPSADVLIFAARRLRAEPVTFLLARRPGQPSDLERAVAPGHLEVGGLDMNAVRRLLAVRLGLFPPRALLHRITDI